jgi:hypothetical protein
MWAFFFSVLLAFGITAAGQDTGWLNPSADSGAFSNGSRAYYDDLLYAEAKNKQTHDYWGYAISVPPGSTILGIELRLDAWKTGGPDAYLYAELSWDGGNSWTATGYRAGPLGTSQQSYFLGGPTDGWGRSWKISELTSELFRVRLRAVCGGGNRIRLDWVAVRVYFSGGLSLTLNPTTVNLGTLTLDDYERGYRDWDSVQEIKLSAYSSWTLYVSASSSAWSYTGDLPDPKKPCGHLLWKVLPSPTGPVTRYQANFTPLSTSDAEVAAGSAGDACLFLAFRLLVDYDTTLPGTYTLSFRYTLVVP